jgi:hypothetical protein
MGKYKYGDKVLLVVTGEEVVISKVSTNYSTGRVKYYVEGCRVFDKNELTKIKHSKEEPKKTRKKRSIPAVGQPDQPTENKEVEKSDISGENTQKD